MNKDNYILSFKPAGTSTIPDVHDPSAVLSKNGKIIAGVEEERLIRIKHAIDVFPIRSIQFCLKQANIDFSDIEKIIIPNDPDLLKKDIYSYKNLKKTFYKISLKNKYSEESAMINPISFYLANKKTSKKRILLYLKNYFAEQNFPPIEFMGHHLCHAASCIYPSGFEEATSITMDGVGDFDSTVIWSWDGHNIKREITWNLNNSLGYFYGAFTVFLGYRFCNGEYKVMGLAPYGQKNKDIFDVFDEIVSTSTQGYDVSEISIPMSLGTSVAIKKIEDLFGIKRRLPSEEFTKKHKDLAFAVQFHLEKIGVNLVKQAIEKTGYKKICLSGGVALNCKMNKKIQEMTEIKDLFIQPIANDAGLALGAVLEASHQQGYSPSFKMLNNYFGPQYSDSYIQRTLNERKIKFSKLLDLKSIAKALANGKFVGWFQGKMEMGPRALGNRSILADPRKNDLKDKLNEFVKHREKWRPYAPSILEEYTDEYIENYTFAPFMITSFNVKERHKNDMEAVLHPSDNTTRPHVVIKENNPRYYELIDEFRKITDIPILLNTSFNDHGEPIICSPENAIRTFYATGLDILVLGDYLINKT